MAPRRAGAFLLHPLTLALLAIWALNDHVLKYALHDALTGKLSDVASLAVFPLLPVTAFEAWQRWRGRPIGSNATLVSWVLATGVVMATINVFDEAAWCYRYGLAALQLPFRALLAGHAVPLVPVRLTMDPTDLFTLPALAIPLWLAWSPRRGSLGAGDAAVEERDEARVVDADADGPRALVGERGVVAG